MVTLRKLRPPTVSTMLGDRTSSPVRRWVQRITLTAIALVLLAVAIRSAGDAGGADVTGRGRPVFVPSLIFLAIASAVLAWVPLGGSAKSRKTRAPRAGDGGRRHAGRRHGGNRRGH